MKLGARSIQKILTLSVILCCCQKDSPVPAENRATPETPSKPEAPLPIKADVTLFRPDCAALQPYKNEPPIVAPEVLQAVAPEFSSDALKTMRVQGSVIMAAVITTSGEVCDVQILKGVLSGSPQLFDEPIRKAVLAYRFSPATLNGQPVAVVFLVSVRVGL